MKILHLGIICLATCLWSLALHGQERANYKAADQFLPSNAGSLIYSKEMKPSYLPGTDRFWFSYKTSQGTSYYLVDPRKKKMEPLFDNERMATQIAELTGKACDTVNLNINPIFEEGKEGEFTFWANQKQLRYDMKTRTCTEIPRQKPGNRPAKPYNPTAMMYSVSSDGAYVAFSKRHNVWLRRSDEPDSLARPLTTDGVKEFSYSDNEMDDNDRIFTTKAHWLKGTHRLFAIRVDNRGIGTLPVVSSSFGRPRLVTSIGGDKYIMPGDKRVPQYELSLLDAETGEVRKVDITKWQDQELKLLHVSADSRYLYLQRTRRTRDELDICRVDTETGEVTVILNEVCKPYFNDRNQSIAFINDDTEFIWWSERSGWGHYYLYSADGQLKSPVTAGEWMAEKIVRIDTARREVYVIGHGREEGMNPYYACLYKATLDGDGAVKLLTPEDANHHVEFSPSGDYFTDNFSRVDMAPRSVLRDKNGKLVRALAEADLSTLLATGWRMPERFTVKAADGKTDLYGVMWKPIDFDSTRKYPVISYVYPGPQMEAVDLDFTVTGNHNAALAQVGFIVVNFGHRGGSPLRDKAYRTYGYGNLRDYALADDKRGIEQLAERHPYIDLDRVGIFGHSGGGFMSAAAICAYPGFYKAAVASSGNHDSNIYNRAWGETFHGVTQTVKGADTVFTCKIPTTAELAPKLQGHLLVITGDEDNNVHPGQSLRLVSALIDAGKNFDMLVLPGQGHQYKGAKDLFWRRKIWFYFAKHLLGDDRADYYTNMEDYKKE